MKTLVTVLSLCATLTACGGGGGSTDANSNTDSKSVPLTTQNFEVVATEVMASSTNLTASSNITNLFIGADVQAPLSITGFVQSNLAKMINNWSANTKQLIGAVTTDSIPCTSGLLNVKYNDALGNKAPDPGDYITVSANNCLLYGSKLNGEMTIEGVQNFV